MHGCTSPSCCHDVRVWQTGAAMYEGQRTIESLLKPLLPKTFPAPSSLPTAQPFQESQLLWQADRVEIIAVFDRLARLRPQGFHGLTVA